MSKRLEEDSRYIAYLLRHHPEVKKLVLDEFGYTDVDTLIKALGITFDYLKGIVDNESRFGFNEDCSKIKAFHGHSVNGIIYQKEIVPPNVLYHGTCAENLKKIIQTGQVKSMERKLVHLSDTLEKAKIVGARHGKPMILKLDCQDMVYDGFKFYKSEDGVFLTSDFSFKYVREII